MKKLISLILISLLALSSLAGCGKPAPEPEDTRVSIVTTIFPPYDFAREVAGDRGKLTMLLKPGSETHSYDPTPADIIAINKSDLFIYIGGESDSWVDKILENVDRTKTKVLTLIDCVEPLEEEIVEGMEADDSEEPELDEHVWTSPKNAKLIVEKIARALMQIDIENANTYNDNMLSYQKKLDELDEKFETIVASAKRKTIVFGDRFPFRYFAAAYGLSYYAAFPGCSTETEANMQTVSFLINKIKSEKIPVVFHAEFGNTKMTGTIAEQTGAQALELHACHNITKDDFAAGKTYLEIMSENTEKLQIALN